MLFLHITNITDTPLCNIAYVQKGYQSANLLTFGLNYEDKTNYSSNIFIRHLINQFITSQFQKSYLKSFVLRQCTFHSLSPGIYKMGIVHEIWI